MTFLRHARLTGKPDTNWRQMGNAVHVKSGMKGYKVIKKKEKIKELKENELVKDNKKTHFYYTFFKSKRLPVVLTADQMLKENEWSFMFLFTLNFTSKVNMTFIFVLAN